MQVPHSLKIATLVVVLSASFSALATLPSRAAAGSRGDGGHSAPAGPSGPSGAANSSGPSGPGSHGLSITGDDRIWPPRRPNPVALVPSDAPLDRGQCTPRSFYDDDGEPHLVQRCQRHPRFW